ncbi:MAG: hypothetical protein ACPK7O_01190 [Methanobacterium sp.]
MPENFTFEQIKNDRTVQKFLKKKVGLRPSTIEGYLYPLKDFCNVIGKTPTEIFELHYNDLDNNVPEFKMWLSEAFDDFVASCIQRKKMYSTIKQEVSKIKGFFHAFKLKPTPTPDINIKPICEDAKHALTVEDIRKAVKHSESVYQALFITMAQTGLAVGDALSLDVKDFILAVSKKGENLTVNEAIYRVKNEDNIIGCLDLRRKKTKQEFYTFIGPEALRSMASLLELRDEEYLKPEIPIFIKEIRKISKNKEKCEKDLRLNSQAVDNYTHRLHSRKKIFPRIEVDGKERNHFRTHKIRKWFSNQLRFKAHFASDDVKYLMGQKTGDVLEQYINPNNYNALKGNYRKALPYLAIIDEIKLEENQEAIEKLERENELLKEQLKIQNEQHQAELARLAEKVDKIENSWINVYSSDGSRPLSDEELKNMINASNMLERKIKK